VDIEKQSKIKSSKKVTPIIKSHAISAWHFIKNKFWISPLFIILAIIMISMGFGKYLLFNGIVLLVHEFSHAEMARRRGYQLNSFKLMPYGAALSGDFAGIKPTDEILIAIAGPISNLILAGSVAAFWWFAPNSYLYTQNLVYISLYFALFNLLPLYPLDGGRVLLAALSKKFSRPKIYKVLRIIGFIAGGIFAVLGFFLFYFTYNISLAIIAIFFFVSSAIPDKKTQYMRLYSMAGRSEKIKNGLVIKQVLVSSDTSILSLVKMLKTNYFFKFTVLDKNFKKLAEIDELELEKICLKVDLRESIGKAIQNL